MKFKFAMKVTMLERLKILWLGGLHLTIDYRGQHKVSTCKAEAISNRNLGVKENDSNKEN